MSSGTKCAGRMKDKDRKDIAARFTADDQVDEAVRQAVKDALADHKRRHNTVAVWRDGKVLVLPAEQIEEDGKA